MNRLLTTTLATLALSACPSTWHGVKGDAGRNWGKIEDAAERGWNDAKEAVKKDGNAVGHSISHAGEKLEDATE